MEKELIGKLKQAQSPAELITLAKENGLEITEEQAKVYFEQLKAKAGELSDDELAKVAGGVALRLKKLF